MTSPVIEAMARAAALAIYNDPETDAWSDDPANTHYDSFRVDGDIRLSIVMGEAMKALEENITDEMLIVAQGEMFEKTGSAPPSTAIAIGFTAMLRAAREE